MMSMESNARKVMEQTEEVLNEVLRNSGADMLGTISGMENGEFNLLKKTIDLYRTTKNFMIAQACFMDRMMEKLEFLEEQNGKNLNIQEEILKKLEKKNGETGA